MISKCLQTIGLKYVQMAAILVGAYVISNQNSKVERPTTSANNTIFYV